jgi:hypothetical protein
MPLTWQLQSLQILWDGISSWLQKLVIVRWFIYECNFKYGVVSLMEGAFSGKEILTTEDGSESATSTFYEITRFNIQSGEGRGIAIATFHTNSTTGVLAPLNGMILTGIDELYPDQTGRQTLWEWQSGIPLPPPMTTASPEPSSMMSTTTATTMTNVTTTTTSAADTNATTTEGEEEDQGERELLEQPLP